MMSKISTYADRRIIAGLILIYGMLFSEVIFAQRLDLFTSESGKIMNGNKVQEVPYPKTLSYFDFIDSTETPDEKVEGHSWYYLYLYLPIETEEIGVRMLSPVPGYFFANAGDKEADSFTLHSDNRNDYFDPMIILEKADTTIAETDLTRIIKIESWKELGTNDDSKEAIAQPNGKFTNSVLRVSGKKYSSGLYRIRFTSLKNKVIKGTYLVQIGLIPECKGIKISRTYSGF